MREGTLRIAYLDCVGGISGDMFVGALLDAGWPEDSFRKGIAWLGSEIAELRVETRSHHSLQGKGIVVVPAASHGKEAHGHSHAHHHRGLADVVGLLRSSPLPGPVVERACEVFAKLAEAEGRAHGKPVDQVRFHEVGAVDAIVDVAAACLGLSELGVEQLYVSPLPLGSGTIQAAHGTIPLPAPATSFLLEGAPVRWTGSPGERCTPTGVALAATLGRWGAPARMRVGGVGCGAGTRTVPEVPNIARLFIGEVSEEDGIACAPGTELGAVPLWGWAPQGAAGSDPECPGSWGQVAVLSTQLDDATPEEISHLVDRLREAGALDLFLEPAVMKKGRPGTLLTVIARPGEEEALTALLLQESSTLGVRWRLEWRRELERRSAQVETPFGPVEVKLALRGETWVGKPEYEACREAAAAAGVAFREVWRAALAALDCGNGAPGVPRRRPPRPEKRHKSL